MRNLLFIFTILVLCRCNNNSGNEGVMPSEPAIKYFKWLSGTWKFTTTDGTLFEIWSTESDTTIKGRGLFIAGTDTTFSEELKLLQRGNDLFYVATVANQNNGQPVYFKYSGINKGEYLFVNKEHDFPQRIIYKNPQPDFLCVRIEGEVKGKHRQEDFNFLKIK